MINQLPRKILLGIGGGIAAYKSAEIVRRLGDHGCDVRVVMTEGAQKFITPLTLQALSANPVSTDLLDERAEAAMGHIELARWADAILVAPATANVLARLAAGFADDLLSTLWLASAAPKWVAPAMNQQMWSAPATQDNIALLKRRSVNIIGPDAGAQACGDVGPGRMVDPNVIVEQLLAERTRSAEISGYGGAERRLDDLKILITAGPTREAIDPVRYVSNHSSGKMGYAVAQAAADRGAEVILISGPTALEPPTGVRFERIDSSDDLYAAVMQHMGATDIFIATAAVADYKPAAVADVKIKKNDAHMSLDLVKTHDVLAAVSAHAERPFCVGFAAETNDVAENARIKLERKKLDMLAANRVGVEDSGFASDYNELEVFWDDSRTLLPRATKVELAAQLMDLIVNRYHASRSAQDSR